MDRRQKTIFASAVIVVVLVVGLWGVDFQSALSVSDLTDEHIGKQVQVNGTVMAGTLRYMDKGGTVLFTLTDGHNDVDVSYVEHQPVNLIEGNHAAVTGKFLPDHTIAARQITTKCPSKYSTNETLLNST